MKRKAWVTAAEAGAQLILVGLDRSFGGVCAMGVRGDKMVIDDLQIHKSLQAEGSFIVQHL